MSINVYGYIATRPITSAPARIKRGDIFYIGLARDVIRRTRAHLEPSRKHKQLVNTVLQANVARFETVLFNDVACTITGTNFAFTSTRPIVLNETAARAWEKVLIAVYNPVLNRIGRTKKLTRKRAS